MKRLLAISAGLLIAVTLGCGSGDARSAAADTTARNLTLAPTESSAVTGDVAAPQPSAAAPSASTPAPRPRARPPVERRPAAPAMLSLAPGTRFELAVGDTITSRTAKVGDPVTATVVEEVKDAAGRVVIPAGSSVRGQITAVKPAPNPNETGTLTLSLSTLTVRGGEYPLEVVVDSIETVHKGRGITGRDAAKVGAGAAAGAIVGRIIGKDTKGTVIGGAVGAAVGAGVAAGTKDVDIVLPKGAHIVVRLASGLQVRAS
ncbi:MAG TPA: glycine zipper domain-containing protein [Gemmatimonadales bacterium]